MRARPEEQPSLPLQARLEDGAKPPGADRDGVFPRATLRPTDDGWYQASFGLLPPGGYRLTVFGPSALEPVSDVFVVFLAGA